MCDNGPVGLWRVLLARISLRYIQSTPLDTEPCLQKSMFTDLANEPTFFSKAGAYAFGMNRSDVEKSLKDVEELLGSSLELPDVVELAIRKLLNLVEALCSDKQELMGEVDRLRKQLEEKKRGKNSSGNEKGTPKNLPSGKRRPSDPNRPPPLFRDRRSGKELEIHETVPCPIDPSILPPDAIRHPDRSVVVQNIVIKPHNIEFLQEVYYSPKEKKSYRGVLPAGYDTGDFGPELRALILSLKYCGNMSEPKIGEFLNNFNVEVSSGSLSNILTKSAEQFEDTYDQVLESGLTSTNYQQTDDTSARVAGKSWHTHIVCNPFYTFYSTRPNKDRLSVLSVLQNVKSLRFRFNAQTLALLEDELKISAKWREKIASRIEEHNGDFEFDASELTKLLDGWMKTPCSDDRLAISHASAIVYYRNQTCIPVVKVLACDDAKQFKLLTEEIALCWIHEGRHYERLSPVVEIHKQALEDFFKRYWEYYGRLQEYKSDPVKEQADALRKDFTELLSKKTGYDDLDCRMEVTAAKHRDLLTVLDHPDCPLHNNISELGARVSARRRDVSLHSTSEKGAHSMDVFTTIVQTCKKLSYSAYEYFRQHLRYDPSAPILAKMVAEAANAPTLKLC